MAKSLFSFGFKLFIFTAMLFAIQQALVIYVYQGPALFYATWQIYLFHIIVTFLIYFALRAVHKFASTYTGYAFLGCSFFKMILAVVFLIPLIKKDGPTPVNDVIAFFIPYFLYLIFETLFAIKLLNSK
ncbi:hypothetical protein ACG2LH_03275 [Zhouia sp. PK063]|uniref:hypothetical protein n=1 Tax=Zhouia sp. PK063 TaxID=3373602 RepID=UPI0037AD6745